MSNYTGNGGTGTGAEGIVRGGKCPDARHVAAIETVYKSHQDDLRFADAKALFVGGVVGAWAAFVFGAIELKGIVWSRHPGLFKPLVFFFALSVVVSVGTALWAIYPRFPKVTRTRSVHQPTNLKRFGQGYTDGNLTESQRAELGTLFEPDCYLESLQTDLGRVAKRCVEKYRLVRVAVVAGLVSIFLGLLTLGVRFL